MRIFENISCQKHSNRENMDQARIDTPPDTYLRHYLLWTWQVTSLLTLRGFEALRRQIKNIYIYMISVDDAQEDKK